MVKFFLYKIGQFIVNKVPLEFAYRFATFISDMQYYFSPRDRKAVQANMRVILDSDENIGFYAREVFRNFGKYLVEFFRMSREIDKEFLRKNVKIENEEYVKEALGRGKGVIFLTGHIGNWEMGGLLMSELGYEICAIAMPHKERPVNELFNEQRKSKGVDVVPMNIAVRRCIKELRQNRIVAVLADRDFSENGEVLSFFGKETIIPKGAAVFASKTGAAIVPMFLTREGSGRFVLEVDRPIYPPEKNPGHEDGMILQLMKRHTEVIEEKIRQYPTQWLMFRRFWIDKRSNAEEGKG